MQDSPLRHEPHAWLLQALAESHSTNGADEITPGLSREAVAPPIAAIDMARYLWARVLGIGFLAPVFTLIRSGLVAFAGSVPVKIFLCVLYAYGSPQLDPRHPEKLDRYAELAKNDKTATQSHLTESTFIFDQGFILVGSFVDILFTLVAVTIVMRVCKYLTPEPAWWMLV